MSEFTRILEDANNGDLKAADQLLPLVYEELRKLAAFKLANEKSPQTLQPTALVHEAWLRLTGSSTQEFQGRAHFFGAAAEAMRRILVDNARRKLARRHGGGQDRVKLDDVEIAVENQNDEILAVDEALDKLAVEDPTKAEIVKLRYFSGLTIEEVAKVLEISVSSAHRRWRFARAWLYDEIKSSLM